MDTENRDLEASTQEISQVQELNKLEPKTEGAGAGSRSPAKAWCPLSSTRILTAPSPSPDSWRSCLTEVASVGMGLYLLPVGPRDRL